MKKYGLNEITIMQFIFINFGVQSSIGLLALPQVLADRAGTDGWMGILIGWIFSTGASLVIIQVMKKYPDGTLLDLLTHYLGEWAGKAGAILYALYFLLYGYLGLVRTVLYTKAWLLPQTPGYITMLLLLIPTYTIARNGLRIIGRYVELVIFLSLWIPFVYLLPLKDAHWLHLFPIFKEGWRPIWSAFQATILSYLGFGVTLFLYPFLQNKPKASIGIAISNAMSMLLFLFITLVCFAYFSPDEMKAYNEPVVNVLKTIEFKFIERIEMLFIAFYLFIFSFSWIPTIYISVFCTSWLFAKQDHRSHLRVLWLALALVAFFYIPTFNQSDRLDKILTKAGLCFEYAFPACLLIYIWIHDRLGWRK
ncbi:endospore germination permease [Paenibacillus sp. SI8]|uniref:GerAB/ArcD/ProY family transporter n=1 Tax=unclassified Paenibacillus TaxID=185978 RepID=UPI0034664990